MKSFNKSFFTEKLKLNSDTKIISNNYSINDAENGDILTAQYNDIKMTFIFRNIEYSEAFGDSLIRFYAYYDYDDKTAGVSLNFASSMGELNDYNTNKIKVNEATTHEINLLFAALKKIGYIWDKNKKILQRI